MRHVSGLRKVYKIGHVSMDVLDTLQALGPSQVTAIAEHTGREGRRVQGVLQTCLKAKLISRSRDGHAFVYTITRQGETELKWRVAAGRLPGVEGQGRRARIPKPWIGRCRRGRHRDVLQALQLNEPQTNRQIGEWLGLGPGAVEKVTRNLEKIGALRGTKRRVRVRNGSKPRQWSLTAYGLKLATSVIDGRLP